MITKYEPVGLYKVVRGADAVTDNTETLSLIYNTVGLVADIKNPLTLQERFRQYATFVNVTVNYTPGNYAAAQLIDDYAIGWRGKVFRVVDAVENMRESITFTAYDANVAVDA